MTPPRFIPFAYMTEQEQREHLRRVHGWPDGYFDTSDTTAIAAVHRVEAADWSTHHAPHTHDKPLVPFSPAWWRTDPYGEHPWPESNDKPARTRTEEI